jgi:hypothetical protein
MKNKNKPGKVTYARLFTQFSSNRRRETSFQSATNQLINSKYFLEIKLTVCVLLIGTDTLVMSMYWWMYPTGPVIANLAESNRA